MNHSVLFGFINITQQKMPSANQLFDVSGVSYFMTHEARKRPLPNCASKQFTIASSKFFD